MVLAIAASALLTFGGVPFGASEENVVQSDPAVTETQLANGSRGLSRTERIAGYDAIRTWVIRDGKFVEGILLFSFKGDESKCREIQQIALSAIEANYGVAPTQKPRDYGGNSDLRTEMWVATLAGGGRIEQRLLYNALIRDCTVSGRYFPPVEGSSAF